MKYFVLTVVLSMIAITANATEIQVPDSEGFESSKSWNPRAFKALESFITALDQSGYDGKSLKTYNLLSQSDRDAINKTEYLDSIYPPMTNEIADLIAKHVTYELKGFDINSSNSITFTIEQTYPVIETNLVGELMEGWNTDTNAKIEKFLSSNGVPVSVVSSDYTMVKENGTWTVFMGVADRVEANKVYENAKVPDDLLNDYTGSELVEMKEALIYSKDKLEKVLVLNESHYVANLDLKRINKLIKKLDNFENYSKLIEIKGLQVAQSTAGGDGIFGSIKNTSNQSFDTVQITFYYLDNAGKVIYEDTYKPVSDGIYSSSTPLKANYVKEFGIKAETPLGWSKKIKAVISDIEVSKK